MLAITNSKYTVYSVLFLLLHDYDGAVTLCYVFFFILYLKKNELNLTFFLCYLKLFIIIIIINLFLLLNESSLFAD